MWALATATARPGRGRILDKAVLHRGGAHLRAGRTCGLRSQVTACQPCLCCHSRAGPGGCAENLPTGPGTQAEKRRRPPGNPVVGQCPTQNAQQSQLPPGPASPSRPGNRLLSGQCSTPGPAGVPGDLEKNAAIPSHGSKDLGRQSLSLKGREVTRPAWEGSL